MVVLGRLPGAAQPHGGVTSWVAESAAGERAQLLEALVTCPCCGEPITTVEVEPPSAVAGFQVIEAHPRRRGGPPCGAEGLLLVDGRALDIFCARRARAGRPFLVKVCNCGRPLLGTTGRQRFCSVRCRVAAHRGMKA